MNAIIESNRKYDAGMSVGKSDLARNGQQWCEANLEALHRISKDDPSWLAGYEDGVNAIAPLCCESCKIVNTCNGECKWTMTKRLDELNS